MDHIAIMKKSWGLTEKILSGEKQIESRWYKTQRLPWDRIKAGETIYFKDSGEPVALKARIKKVLQISGLNPGKVRSILEKYGRDDGIEENQIREFYQRFRDKKYCLLIFLEKPERIRPFKIDKTGFGAMTAWIIVDDISRIRK